jgi:CheY-like chemotaxis protein/two-component sensor histidine kinase
LNLSLLATEKMKIEEENFSFRDFLASLRKLIQIKADTATVVFEYSVDKNIPEKLLGDVRKLTQIFYNILHNAIRLSDSRGVIKVDISSRETDGQGVDLIVLIKDHGKFIPQHRLKELLHADNLLKSYSETDSNNEERMHEIGISIVSKLVKTLEGKLEIASKDGIGTTYKFEIPLKVAKIVRARTNDLPEGPIRLLLVEDHFLNQIATKKVLTAWSDFVSVDIAENGMIGVEKFREHGYDAILMDIQMPVMNGIESARRIREQSEVPIIALTANSSRLEMERCFEVGMNDYLAKPFKPQELFAKILNLVSGN